MNSTLNSKCETVKEECLEEVEKVREELAETQSQVIDNTADIMVLKDQMERDRQRMAQEIADARANNLVFAGFKETKGEKRADMIALLRTQIGKIENEDFPDLKDAKFGRIKRDGQWRPDQTRPRDIIVTFQDYDERCAVLAGKKKFDKNIYCNADLPKEMTFAQRTLKPIVEIVKDTPYEDQTKIIPGGIKIGKRRYGLHNLHTMPDDIKYWANNVRMTLFLMVWFGILCPLSNFFYSPMIIMVKKTKRHFLFAEQYIQYMKALLFGDDYTARAILMAKDPYTCKRLGYKIKGFKQEIWDAEVPKVCDTVLRAKVNQNEHIKQFLLTSHPKILAEAAPKDSLWACGLSMKNDRVLSRKNWIRIGHGGMKYMEIRSELLNVPMPDLSMNAPDILAEQEDSEYEDTASQTSQEAP